MLSMQLHRLIYYTCNYVEANKGVNYCRLDMYLKVEGAEPYIYSTPWVQKGKPFWCEFIVKAADTATDIAKRLEQTINSNHISKLIRIRFL